MACERRPTRATVPHGQKETSEEDEQAPAKAKGPNGDKPAGGVDEGECYRRRIDAVAVAFAPPRLGRADASAIGTFGQSRTARAGTSLNAHPLEQLLTLRGSLHAALDRPVKFFAFVRHAMA